MLEHSASSLVCGLALAVPLAACGTATPSEATAPTASAFSASSREGCEVQPGGPSGPVNDPSGPYYHQVAVGRTTDGRSVSDPVTVLDHASVPDGVRLVDGSLRVYYVNGADGGVWVARLDDSRATPLGPISIDGVQAPAGVADPDATALSDGRVRLAYLSSFGPPGSTRVRAMCLADSTDGFQRHPRSAGRAGDASFRRGARRRPR
jgi:hypothetical protein